MLAKMKYPILSNKWSTLAVILPVVLFSCSSGTKQDLPDAPSTAFFDEFSYRGHDEFYENHPLTSDDQYYNPILPGWYSDPSICTNGEDYFMVTSTFVNFPGVPIFHSKDLVNWKQIGHVLDRESQLVNMIGQHTSGGIFAPAIEYNPHNETYYMITTNVGAGNFFVKTKDPFSSWSDPIRLPDVGGIDPSFFFDDDGKAYIVNNDEPPGEAEYDGHRTIRIREFDVENDRTVGENKILVNKGVRPEEKPIWIEGPHLYKIEGSYFLMSAEGGTGPDHSEVILRGDSPIGPFIPWENNPILTQRHLDPSRPNPITCAGHADLIQTPQGDWWAVFLACRPIEGKFENLGRETFLMPVRWSADGFPYLTTGEEVIPMIGSKPGVKRAEDVSFGNFEKTDHFDSNEQGLEWMTMRTSAFGMYSLDDYPGYLALKCGTAKASEKETPAFVCRRLQHHQFTVSTTMVFRPETENEKAGLLIYKDESHHYFMGLQKKGESFELFLEKTGRKGNEILAAKALNKNIVPLKLKITSNGKDFAFSYSENGKKWVTLAENIDAYHLSTANSYGFTGTTIGMYAVK